MAKKPYFRDNTSIKDAAFTVFDGPDSGTLTFMADSKTPDEANIILYNTLDKLGLPPRTSHTLYSKDDAISTDNYYGSKEIAEKFDAISGALKEAIAERVEKTDGEIAKRWASEKPGRIELGDGLALAYITEYDHKTGKASGLAVYGAGSHEEDYAGRETADGTLKLLAPKTANAELATDSWGADKLLIRAEGPNAIADAKAALKEAVQDAKEEIAEHIKGTKEPETEAVVSAASQGKQRGGGRGFGDADPGLRILPNRDGFGAPGEYDQY